MSNRTVMTRFILSLLFLLSITLSRAQMTLSGDATGSCDCYTITNAGSQASSIWAPEEIDLTNPFDFTFNISLGDSDGGADGMVFVLRADGTTTGALGSLLGYGGIDNSIGIEIDTWQSAPEAVVGDIPEDHIAINVDGSVDHELLAPIAIDNIEDGGAHFFNVIWDPVATELRLILDGDEIFTYTEDIVTTIFGGDPNVTFGWTGATGGAFNTQIVCMYRPVLFSFEPEAPCPGEEITFNNESSSNLSYNNIEEYDWNWDFGDGTTSTDENPTHTFPTPGTYPVTLQITDISGCISEVTNSVIVTDLTPVVTDIQHISCFGMTDGEVTVSPDADENTYLWDDPAGQTTATATGLAPGTYTVTITNPAGCSGSTTVTIIEPAPLTFADISTTLASCGEEDGTITITPGGGTGPYNYSFEGEPFTGTSTFTGLGFGSYTITIQDDNGCETTETVDVESEGLAIDLIYNAPTCNGFSDGSITIIVLGETGEVIFEITNADGDLLNEDNSNTANSLNEGWYYINVEDDSDCDGIDSIFIDDPDEIIIDLSTEGANCYGESSGWAHVDSVYNATGDQDSISFFWTPNPAGENGILKDSTWMLTAGSYTLTVNDQNGCSQIMTFEISQPEELVLKEFDFTPAFCRIGGYQSGSGTVFGSAIGGVSDYTYLWTNLDNGETEIATTWGGLNPGNYQFTATDQHGCTVTQALFLDSLNPVAIFDVISDDLNTDCQGTAPVEVVFENQSINYSNPNNPNNEPRFFWNLNDQIGNWTITDDIETSQDTTYLSRESSYDIEVCLVATNKNKCVDTTCKILTIYKPVGFTAINIFTPNNDGVNDLFTFQHKAASIKDFNCVIVNRWGTVVGEINNILSGWDGTDKSGDLCKSGVYFYSYTAITDNNTTLSGQGSLQLVSEE